MQRERSLTAADIISHLGPLVLQVRGDTERPVTGVGPISAPVKNGLCFAKMRGDALRDVVAAASDLILLCHQDPMLEDIALDSCTIICVEQPRLAFALAVQRFFSAPPPAPGVHPTAVIEPGVEVHPTASIGAFVSIGAGSSVGAASIIFPHVTIYPGVRIGERVIVHSGSVIGADGFGHERRPDGRLEKFPQIGGVLIADDVEIGANNTIDRGAIVDTVIGRGSRLDDQVHVGHNCQVGEDVVITAQCMLAGGVVVEDRAWLAPSAAILNQVTVAADSFVGIGAVVVRKTHRAETVAGVPAVGIEEFKATRRALKGLLSKREPSE